MNLHRIFASLALACVLCTFARAETTSPEARLPLPPPNQLKIGDVSKDETTSSAVEEILRRCAEQYSSVEHLVATGSYIQATKSSRRGETVSDLRLKLIYQAPDKLRIEQEGPDLHTVFLADGTTVTQVNHSAREYVHLPQPDELSAFTEEERAGELAEDETNGIANSVIASLLLTPDPLIWIHSNVQQYVYEGLEDVTIPAADGKGTTEVSCWRIKFIQENPEILVVNWIDRNSFFLRKVSIIQAVDSDGEFAHSYKSATNARMRITIFDELTTGPEALPKRAFTVKVPQGYEPLSFEEEITASTDESESGWTRLVRAAVAEKGETTSSTITAYYGGDLLRVSPFYEMDSRVTALASGGNILGSPSLLVGSVGKQLAVVRGGDKAHTRFPVADPVDQLQPMAREGAAPLIIAAQTDSGKVRALTTEGKTEWIYERATPVASIATSRGAMPGRLYVAYQDGRGLWALDGQGKVRYATRRFASLDSAIVAHESSAAIDVLAHGVDETATYNWDLKLQTRFASDLIGGPAEIDPADPDHPIVMIRFSNAEDAVLQRISAEGETSWSLILAPNATDLKGAAVDFAKLRLPKQRGFAGDAGTTSTGLSEPTRCIFTLLSDGRITIATMTGDLVYRGQLAAQGTLANRRDQWRTFGLAIQDMDQDGQDEIYTAVDAQLVRIEVRQELRQESQH